MSGQTTRHSRLVPRRRFLGGAAALGAVGLGAAACGSGSKSSAQETPVATIPQPSGKIVNPRDAVLPPVSPERTLDLTLEATDATYEVAAGIAYNAWTFGGTVPAPVIHLREGDNVNFKLVNNGKLGHSIDFHSAQIDWAANYKSIEPGESLEFQWQAKLPGAFMYHCGTPPVLHHIGNGMYGAVIVQPANGFPQSAGREYWLVQSEFYLTAAGQNVWTGDMDKMKAARPDIMAWNGKAFQYKDNPLPAKVGERVRLYVVNAGPTLWSAFHIIGALFDVVYVNGNPRNPLYGLQTFSIGPGDGAVCDVIIPNPGLYPFVSHSFAYTELGVVGVLQVT